MALDSQALSYDIQCVMHYLDYGVNRSITAAAAFKKNIFSSTHVPLLTASVCRSYQTASILKALKRKFRNKMCHLHKVQLQLSNNTLPSLLC